MTLVKKKFINLIAVFSLGLSLFAVTVPQAKAAHVEDVLIYWVTHTNPYGTKDEDFSYRSLSYVNGYTYKQTDKVISSWMDHGLGIRKVAHTRTYTTY